MNVSVGTRWEGYIESLLKDGRYGSASEVVRAGLRLIEQNEASLQALRDTINASIERGGEYTGEDIDTAIEEESANLANEGY
jgi:antitoxin ParD1/3/4